MAKIGWLLICWTLWQVPCAVAQQRPLPATYWKQRLFFIPYQANEQGKLLNSIEKVQLLTSRTGANDWTTLEEAKPNVRGFSYHAPQDGEYWFALRHLDRRGQPWPNANVQPQMRIVVDTELPKLELTATRAAPSQIVIRYDARDTNLQPESLRIETLGANGQWSPLQLAKPDIAQPDRLLGRATWQIQPNTTRLEVRARIADRAGQHAQAKTDLAINHSGPTTGPTLRSPSLPLSAISAQPQQPTGTGQETPAATNPFNPDRGLPSLDWPTNNRLASTAATNPRQTPPSHNPYTTQPLGASRFDTVSSAPQSLKITPLGDDNAPSLIDSPQLDSSPWPSTTSHNSTYAPKTSSEQETDNLWSPAQPSSENALRVVNSRTFEVEYDLQSVGPWGVAKVELWGTHDNGRTWQSYGVDPDNRSPIRVTVPTEGTFGFRILVDGANSAGATAPRSGDKPELIVSVDLQPPTAELLAAELGKGNLSDHLLVRWTASDTNLEPRPIALFYSSYPNGPWSTIASGLENTGSYTWRVERHVPGRFYLRLETRDTAGNLATFQTPSPIQLARPQPRGKLRNVRPVASN